MVLKKEITRREFLRMAGLTAAGATLAACAPQATQPAAVETQAPPAAVEPVEVVHWSWLTASDGEIWQQSVDNFNKDMAGEKMSIKMEVVPSEQFDTKVLGSIATGQAPDFGWGTGGLRAQWVKDKSVVAIDKYAAAVGLDLADFTETSLEKSKYPTQGEGIYMVPMDAMSLQMEVNTDHVKEAGLDINNPPTTGDQLIEWAKAMTKRDGDTVTRSGIMMTGAGLQPIVTWGIVSAQMGFQRASEDLKTAAVNPEAGKAAMQWVLDLFDLHKVSSRDVTDRYKAFGTGQGSMFWTGPWTINGYVEAGLPFVTVKFPNIGGTLDTYYELGGLEMYAQKDESRYEKSMKAIKGLSDNSFLWTTVGRGAACRKSILARADYKTAGPSWDVRGAFVEGMEFATEGEIPVLAAPDFTIYTGSSSFQGTILDGVWAKEKSIDQAMDELAKKWQEDLDKG